jgi:putative transposase
MPWRYPSMTVGAIVRGFKSSATRRINALRRSPGAPACQRNYYERVIRNERELNAVREYMQNNPANWEQDEKYVL